jgi:hypothetical protein
MYSGIIVLRHVSDPVSHCFFVRTATDGLRACQALEEMAAKNNSKVTCPHTNEQCDFSKLKKVFIS